MEPTATAEAEASTNGKSGAGSGRSIEVHNPATGKLIGTVPAIGPDEVTALVERARRAQPAWEAAGFAERARILRRAQKWTLDNAERIIATIVAENGKTYEDAQLAEVSYAASAFGFWAKNASEYLADERIKSASPFVLGRKLMVRYAPVGVVGVIGPWNYPLTNSFGDCIPALAAGNAVILKPATLTPMTSMLMAEGLRECGLPEDVFGVAVGEGSSIGNALIDAVDFVMFTGSTEVGKKVMARAAETLTPTAMELGGKDPMIVLRDANLERAANAAVHYVGAMTSPDQTDLVEEQVNDAVSHGARAVVGGHRGAGPGDFFEPTLLLDVDHSMEAMTEETFGPTLPVMKVADVDEAVRLANDSPYGLQASVWTKDVERGEQIARRIEAGVVCVNDAQLNYVALEVPMGGWKTSGVGSRHGAGGIRKFTKQQTLLVTRFAPMSKDVHMLPYDSPRRTKLLGRAFKLLWGRGKRD